MREISGMQIGAIGTPPQPELQVDNRSVDEILADIEVRPCAFHVPTVILAFLLSSLCEHCIACATVGSCDTETSTINQEARYTKSCKQSLYSGMLRLREVAALAASDRQMSLITFSKLYRPALLFICIANQACVQWF